MASRVNTAKSVGSASTFQQDSNVEARLKALEEKAHTPCGNGGGSADLEAKLDRVIGALKGAFPAKFKDL